MRLPVRTRGQGGLPPAASELSAGYPEFRQWWSEHDVVTRDTGRKHLRHSVVGDLHLDWSVMAWAADPEQTIIVWTAERGSPTEDALRLLASWVADRSRSADGSPV